MAAGAFIKVKGDRKLIRKMDRLSSKTQRVVARKAVRAGTTPLRKTVARAVGAMTHDDAAVAAFAKRSIIRIMKTYRHSGVTAGLVGPKAGNTVTTRGRAELLGNILHDVEFGTKHMQPRFFMRRAVVKGQRTLMPRLLGQAWQLAATGRQMQGGG